MTDIYCDWNSDFVLTAGGDIQTATGWDEVRQRIVRRLITNSAQQLPSGITTVPDYVFHPTYGEGLGSIIGEVPGGAWVTDLISRVNAAVLADDAVDQSSMPVVQFSQPQPGTWVLYIAVTLSNQQRGQVALTVTS